MQYNTIRYNVNEYNYSVPSTLLVILRDAQPSVDSSPIKSLTKVLNDSSFPTDITGTVVVTETATLIDDVALTQWLEITLLTSSFHELDN